MPFVAPDGPAWLHLFGDLKRTDAALQAQIRQVLVAAIEGRTLSEGTRLPSSRMLADVLAVARNTVVFAYDQLIDEGYLVSVERSGVFVASLEGRAGPAAQPQAPDGAGWTGRFALRPSLLRHIAKPRDWQSYPYPFLFGQFDPSMFPTQSWRESVTAASSVSSINEWAGDLIDDDDPELLEQLRAQVLPRRGIWAAEGEAMITIGAQQALYLVTRLLVGAGTPVAVEDPGYPDARHMVELAGGIVRPMLVDDSGALWHDSLSDCRLAILTPGHQCPTTAVLSPERRRTIFAAARAQDAVIVEDDYDADMFAEGERAPPLKSQDAGARVIYVGSLSKALAPGLRLGYVVAPAPVIAELRVLRRIMLRHPPSNNQRAMALFIGLGHYRGHLRRLAIALSERAATIDAALPRCLPGFAARRDAGAASAWITGPEGFDARSLAEAARGAGVLIEPGDVFFADPHHGRRCFRLGFSSIRADRIEEGLKRLGNLVS
ncbi:PLP-dependent aminotransferase family protein [Lichenihabitans psoromatis]|uniref:aminotransferase-like domain-containing protein n=1 Tax=Lichenihabitans psoromatis TaxID=2528642 RepID=UPI0010383AFC|nr:PLP-dependent aminotransferase family protein [Lichenihabitans psoromatis]